MMRIFLLLLLVARDKSLSLSGMAVPAGGKKVAVIGATGRLGTRVVQACKERGYQVKCLVREGRAPIEGTETVIGDVSDVNALEELMQDCTAVLGAWGARRRTKLSDIWRPRKEVEAEPGHAKLVNYDGVANVLQAAEAVNCSRVVRITGQNENPWSIFAILINGLGSMAKAYNYEGECLLRRNQQIDYTIIRPGIMVEEDDQPRRLALRDNGEKLPVSKVSYAAIADLMCNTLDFPQAKRTTLVAMSEKEDTASAPSSWLPLLENAGPDRRAFPTTLLAENRRAVRLAGLLATSVSALLLSIFLRLLFSLFLS